MIGDIIATLLAALGGLLIYLYFLRKGQFDDEEEVKFQIFREDQDEN